MPDSEDRRVPSNSFLARLLTVENLATIIIYVAVVSMYGANLSAEVEAAQREAERANRAADRILEKLETATANNADTSARLAAIETDLKWIRVNLEN